MTQVLSHTRKTHVCGSAERAQVWCSVYRRHLVNGVAPFAWAGCCACSGESHTRAHSAPANVQPCVGLPWRLGSWPGWDHERDASKVLNLLNGFGHCLFVGISLSVCLSVCQSLCQPVRQPAQGSMFSGSRFRVYVRDCVPETWLYNA